MDVDGDQVSGKQVGVWYSHGPSSQHLWTPDSQFCLSLPFAVSPEADPPRGGPLQPSQELLALVGSPICK